MQKLPLILLLAAQAWFVHQTSAQTRQIDSALNILKTAPADSNKVKLLNEVGWGVINTGNYFKGDSLAHEAIHLAEKINFKNGLARAYYNLGSVDYFRGNYPAALECAFKTLTIAEEAGNRNDIARTLFGIGAIYTVQNNYTDALNYYTRALAIYKETRNKTGEAVVLNSMANTYNMQGRLEKALPLYREALHIREEQGSKIDMATLLNNIGYLYYLQHNYPFALDHYQRALALREKLDSKEGLATSYNNLGALFIKTKKIPEAKEYLKKGLRLATEIGNKEDIKYAYQCFTELDSTEGNYEKALADYKAYISYSDSLINEENTKKSVRTAMQYEFDKKEEAAKLDQAKKDAIAEAEKKKQLVILLAVSGFGLLVLGFALFAYRSFKQKEKANIEISRQKEFIEEKQKEILDSIHYARRIQSSLLTSERYIQKNLMRLKK